MSTVYNLEPPTAGKVLLHTSLGDLDVELWPKEAPKACRNFVQLCLEGYYDNTIFHRVMKDYLTQGGDPTGSGTGGESIYGEEFRDEFHQRLKFNHRGLLACANRNEPNTNGSQFFFTLGAASWLDKKNTIFGRISGDTIYNLLKFNDLDVDDSDRPLEPPILRSVEVLWNPFEDIIPRSTPASRSAEAAAKAAAVAKAKKPEKKNLKLLSFGEEAEEDETAAAGGAGKIKSAHDVLEDERLAREAAIGEEERKRMRQAALARVKGALSKPGSGGAAVPRPEGDASEGGGVDDGEARAAGDFAASMRERMQQRRGGAGSNAAPEVAGPSGTTSAAHGAGSRQRSRSSDSGSDAGSDGGIGKEDAASRAKRQRRELVESKRRETHARGHGRLAAAAEVADADLLKPYDIMREKYKQQKRRIGGREKETLARLAKFQAALRAAPAAAAASSAGAGDNAATPGAGPSSAAHGPAAAGSGYAGEVRTDIDHRAYMPAAWRVDDYLGGEDEADAGGLAALRGHKLSFAKREGGRNEMEWQADADDYVVFDPLLEKAKGKFSKREQVEKKRGNEWAGRSAT